ncbi:phosphoethanolamine--lipid A transferase EptA [uncultured Tenacibaculum sp.]|uniref:phosphoethanolamine--lipid A transferase EptA n=1 Tax=uncultured Tenacibaculum sp. TaxID=174713 RepID=UPI00262E20F4|nr:phosphoethanolamine--lipid A transferase EptA [uncultured Tenacibaculum sp.]
MLKNNIKLSHFILIISFVNLFLYHLPLFQFTFTNIDYKSLNGIMIIVSLATLTLFLNTFVFYIVFFISRILGKILIILLFCINSIAVYFINTYSVIIDKTMIGNVLNTRFVESSSFLSFNLIVYLFFLGIIPGIFIFKIKTIKVNFIVFLRQIILVFIFIGILVYVNSSNWLWIDKHSKTLGGLVMPWSYIANTSRLFYHKNQENQKQILLPNATVKDNKKSIVVLVIGESARSKNFSLYGYEKKTNPLLSKINNIYSYKANSSATYTTAGVKSILDHKNTNSLFEILPNYLFRNDVGVIWRTTNWGEPKVNIKDYQTREDLKNINGEKKYRDEYDEVLLNGLKEQILANSKNKILVVLHTSTSHGPTYYKKYPSEFNVFTPVCKSVELGKCTKEELMNAYDNTILYTDYILAKLIDELNKIDEYNSTMFYVSDHGESLGEKNLYMHGIPISIAPKEQLEIPFIVWLSDNSMRLKNNEILSQYNVFHSVLDFLAIESPIYNENMSIFKK